MYIYVLQKERKEACHNTDMLSLNVGTVYIFTRTHFGTKIGLYVAYKHIKNGSEEYDTKFF